MTFNLGLLLGLALSAVLVAFVVNDCQSKSGAGICVVEFLPNADGVLHFEPR